MEMKIFIHYDDLRFSQRLALNKKAYKQYLKEHDKYFKYVNGVAILTDTMSFNEWYGTKEHLIYILPLLDNPWAKKELRKMKLNEINNVSIS
jgi:hypothetical protein